MAVFEGSEHTKQDRVTHHPLTFVEKHHGGVAGRGVLSHLVVSVIL